MEKKLKTSVIGAGIAPMLGQIQEAARKLQVLRTTDLGAPLNERLDSITPITAVATKAIHHFPLATLDTIEEEELSCNVQDNPIIQISNATVQTELFAQYDVEVSGRQCSLGFGMLLGGGSFHHIYRASWNGRTNAVIKTPKNLLNHLDLVTEAITHALISRSTQMRPYFIRLHAAVRLPIDYAPGQQAALVQSFHPGVTVDQYIHDFADSLEAGDYVAVLQQIAYILGEAQRHLGFMHRDLKVDNIMILDLDRMPHQEEEEEEEEDRTKDNERKDQNRSTRGEEADDAAGNDDLRRPPTFTCGEITFPTRNKSIQLMDFGTARVQVGNEVFAAPLCQVDSTFNPRTDLAYLIYTMVEDCEKDMLKGGSGAPELHAFLKELCQPLYDVRTQLRTEEIRKLAGARRAERAVQKAEAAAAAADDKRKKKTSTHDKRHEADSEGTTAAAAEAGENSDTSDDIEYFNRRISETRILGDPTLYDITQQCVSDNFVPANFIRQLDGFMRRYNSF